jgi:hypothetical protein
VAFGALKIIAAHVNIAGALGVQQLAGQVGVFHRFAAAV